MADPHERFHFGPRDRRGLLAGARAGQLLVVAGSLVGSLVVLRTVQGPGRGPAALALVLVAVASVTWPIAGRSLDEWAPVATKFASRAVVGANRQALAMSAHRQKSRPRSALGAFDVDELETDAAGPIGMVRDVKQATATVLVALGGETFALLGESERLRRIDAWSGVLASVARDAGSIHRLQWIERTIPDFGDALRIHLERTASRASAITSSVSARVSYTQLIASECSNAFVHELYLALTIRTSSSTRGGARKRGSVPSLSNTLGTELALLDDRCRRAGLDVAGVVTGVGLREMLRRGFDVAPAVGAGDWPWPVGCETTWASIRTDGLWHATFWVAEWPRHEVGSDFFLPLLVGTGCRRTVSVVMAPVAPVRAVRTAEHARTSRVADAELRRRHGFALTARTRREHDAVVRRENELASGHGAFRFSAYVTVSASDREDLERSCRQVCHAASLSGLDLRRLYGTQADAFCCSLPTGRGCE